MVYVVFCYNGKGRCNLGPPKVARVHLTISLTPENRCLLSPLSFYQIPLQELFFLKWSSAFLYCLFFEMHPLPPPPFPSLLFSIHFSFCLTRFFLYTYGRVSLKCISAFRLNINPLPPLPSPSGLWPHFALFFWSQFKKEKRSESFLLSLKF